MELDTNKETVYIHGWECHLSKITYIWEHNCKHCDVPGLEFSYPSGFIAGKICILVVLTMSVTRLSVP